ncbi:hypothetical protein LXA43DRAFT_1102509 [Ganoderma leucocontextum]|nr:hypothetical protein LXA43DRAFT_1102509 [Ganoderma leucocontextum]
MTNLPGATDTSRDRRITWMPSGFSKHPLVVYKEVYDADEEQRTESVMLSLEVLRRYTQLSDRYIDIQSTGGAPGVVIMDGPANLISLGCTTHTNLFDAFGRICLVPT